jgi:hypothetical protein
MNTQQAYINGFVKRASELGYSNNTALSLLKNAGAVDRLKEHFRKYKEEHLQPPKTSIKEKLKDSAKAMVRMERTERLMRLGKSIDNHTK